VTEHFVVTGSKNRLGRVMESTRRWRKPPSSNSMQVGLVVLVKSRVTSFRQKQVRFGLNRLEISMNRGKSNKIHNPDLNTGAYEADG